MTVTFLTHRGCRSPLAALVYATPAFLPGQWRVLREGTWDTPRAGLPPRAACPDCGGFVSVASCELLITPLDIEL